MAPTSSNTTIPWTDHGIPGLVCTQAHWSSVALFFLANYAAHCATIKFYPAETPTELAIAIAGALLFPSAGLSRAIGAIRRRPRLRRLNKIERALASGAMCMVVRSMAWEPRAGELVRNIRSNAPKPKAPFVATKAQESEEEHPLLDSTSDALHLQPGESSSPPKEPGLFALSSLPPPHCHAESSLPTLISSKATISSGDETPLQADLKLVYNVYSPPWMKEFATSDEPVAPISTRKCKIHGTWRLPTGYEFTYVPTNAIIAPTTQASGVGQVSRELATSNSLTKTCLAMLQTGYAAYSVYRARGDQITVYGYAAFGLTVIPYIMMSVLNLVAQAVSDDYSTLYMIHTAEMEEATNRGGVFHGAVAKLEPWDGGIDDDIDTVLLDTSSGPWLVDSDSSNGKTFFRNQDAASPRHLQRIEIQKRRVQSRTDSREELYVPNCSKFRRQDEHNKSRIPSKNWRLYRKLTRRILQDKLFLHSFVWPLGLSLISFTLLGGLSRFQKGSQSTSVERGFAMAWLVTGMLFGFIFPLLVSIWQGTGEVFIEKIEPSEPGNVWRTTLDVFLWIMMKLGLLIWGLGVSVFCVPAIGGFVMVGKMIFEYGSCNHV